MLKAGQLSLHHPWVVHGSGHNSSKSRRIGFAIQSYIGTNVGSIYGKIFVQQARGSDRYGYHQHTPRPSSVMARSDVKFRDEANEALKMIMKIGQNLKNQILNNLQKEELLLINQTRDLDLKNSLLSDNLDLDYVETLIRERFLFGKKNETIYILKNNGQKN